MGYKQWLVDYIEDGNTFPVSQVLRAEPVRSTEGTTNTLSLTLKNYNNECYEGGEIIYKVDSIFKVYAANGFVDKNNPDHLIGTYIISDHEEIAENRTIKITCADKTFNMLSRVFIGTETNTVDELITTIVDRVHMGQGTGTSIITKDIDSTDSSGNAFKSLDISSTTKTAFELITELSQPDATGDDRIYIFWFDENDVFHWKYPNLEIVDTFRYGSYPTITMKNIRQESHTISTVIYNAGTDKDGNGISRIVHDNTATSYRSKYYPMTEIARDLRSKYISEGTYDAMTNEEFVNNVLEVAKPKAEAYIQSSGRAIWETTVECYGGKFNIGGLYKLQLGNMRSSIKEGRLIRISHTMDKNGWMSNLTFEEDVKFGS